MSLICCSCINKLRVQVELVMDKIYSCHVVSPCNRGMLTVFCMWISMVYPPSTVGQPTTSRGFCVCVPWLTREGRGRGDSPFCPLGASFQARDVAALYRRRIRSAPSVRRKKGPLGGAFMGGLPLLSDLSVGGPRPINIPLHRRRYPFRLPPFLPLLSCNLSSLAILRTRAPPRAVANLPSFQPRCL